MTATELHDANRKADAELNERLAEIEREWLKGVVQTFNKLWENRLPARRPEE